MRCFPFMNRLLQPESERASARCCWLDKVDVGLQDHNRQQQQFVVVL